VFLGKHSGVTLLWNGLMVVPPTLKKDSDKCGAPSSKVLSLHCLGTELQAS